AEVKARLLWNFTQFVSRLAARKPVLLVLDDLQWLDASSLELLHFLARQTTSDRVAILAAYNSELLEGREDLTAMAESLVAIGAARECRLRPLSHADISALVH